MKRFDNTLFLFAIILLEGYIVLSSELLAIRMTVPFIGSGTDTISIIIAAVLMPLAFGYHTGGKFKKKHAKKGHKSIRAKLIRNILISCAFFLPGLSYFIIQFFFFALDEIGLEHNTIKITLYSLLFLVTPVYLLGQTVPLVSNFFSKEKLSQITGKMLFISTIGSFCGSIGTTLLLMQYIGAHHTVSVIFVLTGILVLMLAKKNEQDKVIWALAFLGGSLMLNSTQMMEFLHIVKNNKYNTIMVMTMEHENHEIPHMVINNNDSSKYDANTQEKHEYIEFAEQITIEDITANQPPKDILVIGAGGFTFGHNDTKNNYIYIDIDEDLKEIAEEYLLKEKLKDNKIFYPLPARAYLSSTDKKFDVIFLDAYLGGLSIPEHLVTQEFFEEIKEHLKPNAIVLANFILSSNFNNKFSKTIDNTLRSVFPYVSRHNAYGEYNIRNTSRSESINFMYIYKYHETKGASVYTDSSKTEQSK